MVTSTRESRIATAFVTLADTLVVGFDVVDLLQTLVDTCASVLDAQAVGLLLADSRSELEVVASTEESSHLVELLQLRAGDGPCVESFHTGKVVDVPDIFTDLRWPEFRTAALENGFASIHAVPMRLRDEILGTLNLFREDTGSLSPADAAIAQSLADVATIGILQERALREKDFARKQMQLALDSRVVIEQAKGVIAQNRGVDMDLAFKSLRDYARRNGLNLHDVAAHVVARTLTL